MSNGEVCCILGVCCPPERRRDVLAASLVRDVGCDQKDAVEIADWVVERFDLAPRGTLDPLIEAISEMARKHPKG
jgi:hypothetical protein